MINSFTKRYLGTIVLALSLAIFAGCTGSGSGGKTVVVTGSPDDPYITTKDLDPQDFQAAATDITNKMLASKGVQDQLTAIQRKTGRKPLIKISRIKNETTKKINMVDWLADPIEEVLLNSGKATSFSEDKTAQSLAAAHDMMNGTGANLPDLVMYGTVTSLTGRGEGVQQTTYKFNVRLSSAAGENIFTRSVDITKQTR
jgi:hypothetical protein